MEHEQQVLESSDGLLEQVIVSGADDTEATQGQVFESSDGLLQPLIVSDNNETETAKKHKSESSERCLYSKKINSAAEQKFDSDDGKNEVEQEAGSENSDLKIYQECVPEYSNTQPDNETLLRYSEEIIVQGPDMDGACDCGIGRPYFSETWLSQEEVEEMRRIAKKVSSGNLLNDVFHENGTLIQPALEADKVEQLDTVIVKDKEREPMKKSPDLSENQTPQRTPDMYSTETQTLQRTSDMEGPATIWPPKPTIMDFTSALCGLLFFLADVITDWRLAVLYFIQNELTLFYVTLAIILVPALILSVISIIWSCMEHSHYKKLSYRKEIGSDNRRRDSLRTTYEYSKVHLVLRVVFSLLQLGRCFRLLEYMRFVIKSWREKDTAKETSLRKQALQQKQDSAIFGLVDGFLESALQFLLQLYLSISKQIPMDFLRVATICLSWISTAMLMTSFNRNNRKVQKKKQNSGYSSSFFYLMWRICELGPRFVILVLFAVTFKIWCLIPVSLHFIFMIGFYMWQKPELRGICCPGKKIYGYFFLLLMSFIGIFTYMNITDGRTRYRLLAYYIIFYIENIIMSVLVWIYFPSDLFMMLPWKNCLYMLIPGFILHIVFMLTYYRFFHPNKHVGKGGGNGGGGGVKGRLKKVKICGISLM